MKRKQTGKPEVFAIRKGTSGWELSRRSLFSAAAAAAAAPHRASAGVCAQRGATSRVNCIAISPNGRWLASGSDDQTIKLWSLPDGALLKTLVHAWNVYSVAIGPDSRLLASACATDKTIKLWSVPDGALLKTLTGHTNYVRSVDFSPDGKLLASGSWDGTVRLWSLPDGALLKTQTGVGLSQVTCSPDGRILVVLGASMQLWSLPDLSLLKTFPYEGGVTSFAISPDGRLLATGRDVDSTRRDYSFMLHSLPDGALVKTFGGTSAYPESIALTPDLRLLASGNGDGTILLWSLPDGTLLKTITGHSDWVLSTAISPDGRMLASSSSDATIKLWSLPDGKQLPVCLMDPDAIGPAVTGARYTKDGVAYTVPCGTPLPAGAVCTCNCVPGCTCVTAGPGCGTVYWYPN